MYYAHCCSDIPNICWVHVGNKEASEQCQNGAVSTLWCLMWNLFVYVWEYLYLVSEASLISLYAVLLHSSQMSLQLHAREILMWDIE